MTISTPPASASDGLPDGIETTIIKVPAFQTATWENTRPRGGGSVARNADVKNWADPSTSWETPPSRARWSVIQPAQAKPPSQFTTATAAAATMKDMAGK